jgi:DNA-binding MarR family transcriptional regulator
MERFPGYAVGQAFRVLRHALDDALRSVGLTTPQWGTLACIGQNEGISGAEMARMHHLTPQTMNTILHNLEAADLIVRRPHAEHGTVLCVHLTSLGRMRLEEAMERVEAVHTRMMSPLSEEERRLLVDMLNRCAAALEVEGDPPGCEM